jgi:hypothetical protein
LFISRGNFHLREDLASMMHRRFGPLSGQIWIIQSKHQHLLELIHLNPQEITGAVIFCEAGFNSPPVIPSQYFAPLFHKYSQDGSRRGVYFFQADGSRTLHYACLYRFFVMLCRCQPHHCHKWLHCIDLSRIKPALHLLCSPVAVVTGPRF